MGAIIFKNRIFQECTFSGVGAVTLGAPIAGFVAYDDGNTDYVLENDDGSLWEIGEGTILAGVLTRVTVYANVNGDTNFVDFGVAVGTSYQALTAERLNALVQGILTQFTELVDTPADYLLQGGKFLRVNVAEDAVDFGDALAVEIVFDDTIVGGGFTDVQAVIDYHDDQIGLREQLPG